MLSSGQVLSKLMDSLEGKNQEIGKIALNLMLPQVIPFNRPLGLKICKLSVSDAEIEMPFKRANKNHLGGMHACALATVGEYTAGLLILKRMNAAKQRLVLKTLHVDYSKQGRGPVVAKAQWPAEAPQGVESFRNSQDVWDIELTTVLYAKKDKAELCKVKTFWQIKPWDKVRAK